MKTYQNNLGAISEKQNLEETWALMKVDKNAKKTTRSNKHNNN